MWVQRTVEEDVGVMKVSLLTVRWNSGFSGGAEQVLEWVISFLF
jgi:hypothetical protein